MIIVVLFFQFIVFKTPILTPKDYSTAYYNEFKKTPTTPYNYSFSPPVSIYQALLIALESGGWNAKSLENTTVYVELGYYAFFKDLSTSSGWMTLDNSTFSTNSPVRGFLFLYQVTQQPVEWSPRQINGITYRYVWTIIVQYSPPRPFPPTPPGYYNVDAATSELLPTPIF
jgi:hypothetical protein